MSMRALEQLETLKRELTAELSAVNTAIQAIRGSDSQRGRKGKVAYSGISLSPQTLRKVETAMEQAGTQLYADELAERAGVSTTTAHRAGATSPDIVVTRNGNRVVFDWRERVERQRALAMAQNGE
jgi:response regulator of citrate/malate metabolism